MKKLIPLFGILLAAVVVMSTGAFTSVTADREATIEVTDDASALLALEPTETANGAYAYQNGDKLTIDLSAVDGAGVNVDAITTIDEVFTITNNGTQAVDITISWSGDNAGKVNFGESAFTAGAAVSGDTSVDLASLGSGGTTTISIAIDSDGLSDGDELIDTITITATAN
ncbi:DUF1102 domain-containing protein [archaeon]|nr:MAG: DUF1102 domain-containing protein [archaeon]